MKQKEIASAAARFALVATAGFAGIASAGDPGFYLGGNVGESRAEIDDARITRGLLADGFTVTSITDDDRDLGFKVFAGYQFHPWFALEAGYFDLGQFGFTATTTPPGSLRGEVEFEGVNLDAVATMPFTSRFSAFGRVGVNYAEATAVFSGTGAVNVPNPNRSEEGANLKVGAGLEFAISPNFSLRAEAERYRVHDGVGNKGDIDLFSGGLVLRFGRREPAPQVLAPAPVVAVAPPPPAPPVYVAPPPPPPSPPTRVAFSADALFDFDRAEIKPAGKLELDAFAQSLRGANLGMITVTGHTDRIGGHDYNLRLSTRRAEAVRAYLIEHGGIRAERIVARGVDGANPVTPPGSCTGMDRRAMIACLQPDRRVEVEVSGTQ